MKYLSRVLSGSVSITVAAMILHSSSAEAVTIDGGISLAGAFTPNSPDLSTATEMTFGQAVVISSSGDFTMPMFTSVDMADSLVWDPLFSVDSNPLWSVGGFEFELNSLVVMNESANAITLQGMGNVTHADFESTTGTWVATFNGDGDSNFSWSSSTASVPDGGTSIALFGMALVGLGMIRRRE